PLRRSAVPRPHRPRRGVPDRHRGDGRLAPRLRVSGIPRDTMSDEMRNSLREARARRDLTQADLATLVGVSRKTINTVENGVFIPSTVLALRLAKALKVTVESLFQLTR